MTYRIDISAKAKKDLLDVCKYIANDNIHAAEKVFAELNRKILSLTTFPLGGAPRNEVRQGLRALFCGNYAIYYTVKENIVEILRILHTSQDIHSILVQ